MDSGEARVRALLLRGSDADAPRADAETTDTLSFLELVQTLAPSFFQEDKNHPLAFKLRPLLEHAPPLSEWDPEMLGFLFCSHMKRAGRWRLTTFLLGNGVPPTCIASWYLGLDQLNGGGDPVDAQQARLDVANIMTGFFGGKHSRDGQRFQRIRLGWWEGDVTKWVKMKEVMPDPQKWAVSGRDYHGVQDQAGENYVEALRMLERGPA
jgi:hypothetical protein